MKMMIWSKAHRAAAIGLGLAILLAGCGGGSGGAVTAVLDPGSSNSTVTTPTPTPTPVVPTLSVLAGQPGGPGNVDGPAGVAALLLPTDLVFDAAGNLYINDQGVGLRKLNRNGLITTVRRESADSTTYAPVPDDLGNLIVGKYSIASRGSLPGVVRVGPSGEEFVLGFGPTLYADPVVERVLPPVFNVSPAGPTVILPTRTEAVSGTPGPMAMDTAGNLYAVVNLSVIRKMSPSGVWTTLAGQALAQGGWVDGEGAQARFQQITALAVDGLGNLYALESREGRIRKITAQGRVSTLAQGLDQIWGIAVDASGVVYAADMTANLVRKIASDGTMSILPGSSGTLGGGTAYLNSNINRIGIAVDRQGEVFVADPTEATVWAIAPNGSVRRAVGFGPSVVGAGTLAGRLDGLGAAARFSRPAHLAADGTGNVYVADQGNAAVRAIAPGGQVRTVYRSTSETDKSFMSAMTADASGNVYLVGQDSLSMVDPVGNRQILGKLQAVTANEEPTYFEGRPLEPTALVVATGGGFHVVGKATQGTGLGIALTTSRVRRIGRDGTTISSHRGTTAATDTAGNFYSIDKAGNFYCVCGAELILSLTKTTSDGKVTKLPLDKTSTLAVGGEEFDGSATSMVADDRGNVYVASPTNHTVQKISPTGQVTTVVGQRGKRGFVPGALPGVLNGPRGLALVGRTLYISMQNAVVQVTDLP